MLLSKVYADHWNLTSINSEKVVSCGKYDHKRKKKKKSKPETEMPHKDQATSQDSKHFNHMEWVSFSQHNEFRRTSRSQWADNCVCKISKFKVLMSLKCASTLVPISSFNLLCNTENKIKLLNYFWEILISERMVMQWVQNLIALQVCILLSYTLTFPNTKQINQDFPL